MSENRETQASEEPEDVKNDSESYTPAQDDNAAEPEVIAEILENATTPEQIKRILHSEEQSFSGPIPPPAMLSQYDQVEDGLANRIVTMAENQQEHRQKLENTSVNAAISSEKRGQIFAFIISLLVIGGSIYLIDKGSIISVISGTLLAGGSLTGLAYIFITGRQQKSSDGEKNASNGENND